MPKRTNEFQRLITLLTASLAGQARVIESAMLLDKVNEEQREVDILVVAEAGGYNVQIGIEVISWARPADTPWIEKMRAKHENLPTDKLILVSKCGFYEPARRKAEFYGIEVLSLEEANGADWPLMTTLTTTGVFEVMTITFEVAGVLQLDSGPKEQIAMPLSSSLSMPAGPVTVDQFIRTILEKPEVNDVLRENTQSEQPHDFWISYSHPDGLWRYEEEGRSGQITELRVGLRVVNTASPVRYSVGAFRNTPFVSGTSTSGKPVQFVLAKNSDGSTSGYLLDDNGARKLSSN